MWMLTRAVFLAWLLAHLAGTTVADEATEGHEADHDQARRALEAGEIVPLGQILQQVQARYDGTVIEIELAREDASWLYEVELLTADGRLLALWFDAGSALLLREVPD
jgi:uncharacterized membrane protein YkoI